VEWSLRARRARDRTHGTKRRQGTDCSISLSLSLSLFLSLSTSPSPSPSLSLSLSALNTAELHQLAHTRDSQQCHAVHRIRYCKPPEAGRFLLQSGGPGGRDARAAGLHAIPRRVPGPLDFPCLTCTCSSPPPQLSSFLLPRGGGLLQFPPALEVLGGIDSARVQLCELRGAVRVVLHEAGLMLAF
jgi:hypothetical protein